MRDLKQDLSGNRVAALPRTARPIRSLPKPSAVPVPVPALSNSAREPVWERPLKKREQMYLKKRAPAQNPAGHSLDIALSKFGLDFGCGFYRSVREVGSCL